MAAATDRCPGCGRNFTPKGFVNHLRLSHDPRCASARDRLQPTYPKEINEENHRPPSAIDVEMIDLDNRSDTGSIDPDIEMSHCEDNTIHNRHLQHILEDAPVVHPPSTQAPVIFDSDADDSDADDSDAGESDDDNNQNQALRLETQPMISGSDGNLSAHQSQSPEVQSNPTAPFVVRFPGAGEALETRPSLVGYQLYANGLGADGNGPLEWAPFSTQLEWEVARWAKLRGPSSSALSELLQINGLSEALGLSFSNSEQLNNIIDKKLPNGLPQFIREEVEIAGQKYEFYHRDILECVRVLYGDPEIADVLVHAPEEHYTGPDKKCRVFSEMNSGRWWWTHQKELKRKFPGITIIPVILSSDKTRVVLFGTKAAYPVYMTIGNIPKDIRRKPSRRTHVLIGYLPTTQLPHVSSTASRRRMVANLFHHCFSRILEPLKNVGETGVEMTSGDGITRRTLPLFACFVGDYPEQVLVSGCKTGECPKCDINRKKLGDLDTPSSYQDLQKVLDVLSTFDDNPAGYSAACSEVGIKPIVHPFWETLPHSDIYLSLTPDILHQLYQGVMKHLVSWVTTAFNKRDLDARFHTSETLQLLHQSLRNFHANKHIFVELGIREDFNLPKLHSLVHYVESIELFGTTDNYNTEYTERLHIVRVVGLLTVCGALED
ncbi:hypothetical protein BJ322DRAFT_1102226 [Thelephora terrestris]|uniref:C2H2-type domain-containing protein n=1 Tax=Thelephora terrestris TaxID=56493 RepID=A0A9P6H3Y7_9AGAM|nr:hypothetical protein BJ322DRAFT_1102226 [Thelephora terrestris]